MKIKVAFLYITLFVVSSIVISSQISLIQFFAYQQWYHFASIIISMAMIGFGVSGLLIPTIQKKFNDPSLLLDIIQVFASISFLVSLYINQKILGSFDSFLIFFDLMEAFKFFMIIISFTINFTLFALVIGLIFSNFPHLIGKLYSWNLLGSAFGGLSVIILLWFFLPQQILLLNGLLISLTILFRIIKYPVKSITIKLMLIISILLNTIFFISPFEFYPSQFKTISRIKNLPDFKEEYQKNSPYGLIEKASSTLFKYSPGLSLNYTGEIPEINYILLNGEIAGYELKNYDKMNFSFLKNSTLFLPYFLREYKNVLILNALGGIEIFRCLNGYVNNIIITELNPVLMEIIKSQFSGASSNKFKFFKIDPRIFLVSTQQKFDLIYCPAIEPVGLTSGLFAVQEKFLLTKESFQRIYDCLNSGGYFTISCFLDNPPRSFLKVLNLLSSIQIKSSENSLKMQLIAISNWNVITFILKKGEFNSNEINAIKNFCDLNQFDFLINPVSKKLNIEFNSIFDNQTLEMVNSLIKRDRKKSNEYLFNISTPSDDKPYFSNFFKLKNFRNYLEQISLRTLTYSELGYFLIWISFFLITMLAVLMLTFGFYQTQIKVRLKYGILFYFGLIGIAYMLIELSLIQKFTLIFSADVLAISFVITILLISSGLGSLFSKKLMSFGSIRIIIFIVIFFYGLLLIIVFKTCIEFLMSQNLIMKFLFLGLLIFPLGMVMGMPFPVGISLFADKDKNSVPFAWAVNGSFSVIGSLGSILLLINIGYAKTFLIALTLYLLCSLTFIRKIKDWNWKNYQYLYRHH